MWYTSSYWEASDASTARGRRPVVWNEMERPVSWEASPKHVPVSMIDRLDGSGHAKVAAVEADARGAAKLVCGGLRAVVGNAGQPCEATGMALAEAGQPVIIDAEDFDYLIVIIEGVRNPKKPVYHLRVNAVLVLVLDSEVRVGGVIPLVGVFVEAGGNHSVPTGPHLRAKGARVHLVADHA